MFALGAALKVLQAFTDGVVDGLVVAGFEMQAGDEFDGASVAAVQGCFVTQEEAGGDG